MGTLLMVMLNLPGAGLTYRLIRLKPKASHLKGPRGAPSVLYMRSRLTKFKHSLNTKYK